MEYNPLSLTVCATSSIPRRKMWWKIAWNKNSSFKRIQGTDSLLRNLSAFLQIRNWKEGKQTQYIPWVWWSSNQGCRTVPDGWWNCPPRSRVLAGLRDHQSKGRTDQSGIFGSRTGCLRCWLSLLHLTYIRHKTEIVGRCQLGELTQTTASPSLVRMA